jgi:hypothetical protein
MYKNAVVVEVFFLVLFLLWTAVEKWISEGSRRAGFFSCRILWENKNKGWRSLVQWEIVKPDDEIHPIPCSLSAAKTAHYPGRQPGYTSLVWVDRVASQPEQIQAEKEIDHE